MHGAAGGSTNFSFCQHHPALAVLPSQSSPNKVSAGRPHLAPLTLQQQYSRRPTPFSSARLLESRGAQQSRRSVATCFDNSRADVTFTGAPSTPRTEHLWKTKQHKCSRHKPRAHHPSHRTRFATERVLLSSTAEPGGIPQGRRSCTLPRSTAINLAPPPATSSSWNNLVPFLLVAFSSRHNRPRSTARSLASDHPGQPKEAPKGGTSIRRPQESLTTSTSTGPSKAAFAGETRVGRTKGGLKESNHPGRSKQTNTRKQKQKFKRAQFTEIAPEEARAVLACRYSAAEGIPYRAPEEFRLWVQLMMAGPEHVILSEPGDYIFQDGRRLVRPYFFEFVSHVKSRWAGQNIVELFSNEFRQRDRQYYMQAVEDGRLQVDGRKVPTSYRLTQGQTVVHFVHRHEPPVMADPVTVLFSDADVVVVRKPASVPVHPCGQYRKNTVLGILQAEHPELGTLSPIHRLDRLVSGLLILARNPETADRFRQDITANEVQKEYVARVVGVFPEGPVEAAAPLLYDGKEGRAIVEVPEEENDPEAIAAAMLNGGRTRDALTRFRRLSTDGATSVVACQPLTGRTHQIRVHLQYLGHPIANDFLYLYPGPLPEEARKKGGDTTADVAAARGAAKMAAAATVAGATLAGAIRVVVAAKARKAREDAEAARRQENEGSALGDGLSSAGLAEAIGGGTFGNGEAGETSGEPLVHGLARGELNVGNLTGEERSQEAGVADVPSAGGAIPETGSGTRPVGAGGDGAGTGVGSEALFEVDPYCTNCPSIGPTGYEEDQEGLWLHCIRYTGKTWTYECPLPDWAQLN
ncbi:hypothetical protein KFL_001360170 [Klebsormidium nitens]|uniref:Pseudouridine synthase RsuA/RluA-like domain-containing protein n=1 Tax=Klebsormidium nitens TaxID=105231 RepID=A0A1Y1HWT2_KLENI|nr:hypothetical protein KFL_001360170 [Klebsormidium nitens]|eukprot:GAQ83120.1 hypothetical protein KFL_001360170 [Klebsormidium nitens]